MKERENERERMYEGGRECERWAERGNIQGGEMEEKKERDRLKREYERIEQGTRRSPSRSIHWD